MHKKLIGWKGKLLRSVGKLQLLTASLQGMLAYFLSLESLQVWLIRWINSKGIFYGHGTKIGIDQTLLSGRQCANPRRRGNLELEGYQISINLSLLKCGGGWLKIRLVGVVQWRLSTSIIGHSFIALWRKIGLQGLKFGTTWLKVKTCLGRASLGWERK